MSSRFDILLYGAILVIEGTNRDANTRRRTMNATTKKTERTPNQTEATCYVCGKQVKAGEGRVYNLKRVKCHRCHTFKLAHRAR